MEQLKVTRLSAGNYMVETHGEVFQLYKVLEGDYKNYWVYYLESDPNNDVSDPVWNKKAAIDQIKLRFKDA